MNSVLIKFTRGELAKTTKVNSETIRYYEKIGLIQSPARTAGGHRIYAERHLNRVSFIRRSRELGFSLKEIRNLIELVDSERYTCEEVRDRTVIHLSDIEQKLADLQNMQINLKDMISKCDGGLTPDCSIVDTLLSS
ncbi:MAG TPA: MerR family transcriptional regulator [Gammaproteobacteria bacterium]|nr:MerR family transcriptional regulator [Gammaproteobacteria bacterium]